MSEGGMKIKSVGSQERCDVCHQSDMFDPETKFCARCQHIALVKAIEQPKEHAAPLPEFLARRLGFNVAIRCSNCGEFIMSRSSTCRHCGTYVRFDEAAKAAQDERRLTQAFERLHHCKDASSLSWEFLRLHMWGFPLTLLLAPLSAVGSFILFLRTFWHSFICWIKFSSISQKGDPRVVEGRREALAAAGKSAGAFALAALLGVGVVYSGLIAIPRFWDNYSKGRQEYNRGNFKDAEQLFHAATEANPKNVDAHLYYARSIWSQYIPDINADKARNEDLARRAIAEFRAVLDQTQDMKIKDEVYNQLAEICKTTKDRNEFEQWMLARAALPNQSLENQVDSYVKLGTVYANDLSILIEKYLVKGSFPPTPSPARMWEAKDREEAAASALKANRYLSHALEAAPEHELALPLYNKLQEDLRKIELKLDGQERDPFSDTKR